MSTQVRSAEQSKIAKATSVASIPDEVTDCAVRIERSEILANLFANFPMELLNTKIKNKDIVRFHFMKDLLK
ncbi:MAG: hypothetical protein K2K85_01615 [Clostridia bacterium]|nr:hypothetical protein [Clostridia bacterium]